MISQTQTPAGPEADGTAHISSHLARPPRPPGSAACYTPERDRTNVPTPDATPAMTEAIPSDASQPLTRTLAAGIKAIESVTTIVHNTGRIFASNRRRSL